MALTYQFNRMAIQDLRRRLKARQTALPTLKNKETALRAAVQDLRQRLQAARRQYDERLVVMREDIALWAEFPSYIFVIERIVSRVGKVTGIAYPEFVEIVWNTREFSKFNKPAWVTTGIRMIQELAAVEARIVITGQALEILEKARQRTTQKVNLYEKVQIPEYEEAILKVKRRLEDVDNLSKAAQKLTKSRLSEKEAVALAEGRSRP
jgi:V/A-type H+-transporting ATPase subunit D